MSGGRPVKKGITAVPPPGAVITRELARLHGTPSSQDICMHLGSKTSSNTSIMPPEQDLQMGLTCQAQY